MSQGMKGMSECDPIYPLMNILPGLQVEKCKTILFLCLFSTVCVNILSHEEALHIFVSLLETDVEYFKRKKISGKKDKEI